MISRDLLDFYSDQKLEYSFGIFILLIFAVFRPVITGFYQLGAINILVVFGLIISFLIFLAILINLDKIKLDTVSFLSLIYCIYCTFTIIWGSQIREVARFTLPILIFLLTKTIIKNRAQLLFILKGFIIGYSYLIIASALLIITGKSQSLLEYRTGLERFQGVASGQHALAHSMLAFSFIFALFKIEGPKLKKFYQGILLILLIGSIFCLFKTYTRTAYLGLLIFWFGFLWGFRKKWLFIFLSSCVIITLLYGVMIKVVFWQVRQDNLNYESFDNASSGRLTIWSSELMKFSKLTLEEKLLGLGFGEREGYSKSSLTLESAHNDFIGLLVTSGIFGVAIYIAMLLALIKKIISSSCNKTEKYYFLSVIGSVIIMNIVSNSYISRFEIAQLFWFIMGLIFVLDRLSKNNGKEYHDK